MICKATEYQHYTLFPSVTEKKACLELLILLQSTGLSQGLP